MFGLETWVFWWAVGSFFLAGLVKGAIGFAMPMILMSSLGSVMPAQTALALLILPTIVANIAQAFRQGPGAMWASTRRYGLHISMVVLFLAASAQLAGRIPQQWMYILLGAPITFFALWQIAGRSLAIPIRHRAATEAGLGIVGGLYGGISGIWGPPILIYLISVGAGKVETVRVQGVVFLIGAVALALAHLRSGLLNGVTLPASALMVVPAMLGMAIGLRVQDRLDAAQFRRWTLLMLLVSGANLILRAMRG